MINHNALVGFCLAGLCLLGAPSAFAGPIVFFNQYQAVRANATNDWSVDGGAYSALVTDTGEYGTSIATQDSTLDASFLGGVGAISRPAEAAGIEVFSTLATFFTLDENYLANVLVEHHSDHWSAVAYSSLFNLDTEEEIYGGFAQESTTVGAFDSVLTPGSYAWFISVTYTNGWGSSAGPVANGSWAGGLTLTPLDAAPVPEPASMTLVGLGLAAASAKRWRARRRAQ